MDPLAQRRTHPWRLGLGFEGQPCAQTSRSRQVVSDRKLQTIQFTLQREAGGLYVERQDIPFRGLRVAQLISFADAAGFERWCDADALRFDDPLLHAQLKRAAQELWRESSHP